MSEWLLAALALPAGTLLGLAHFYGLRYTTRGIARAKRPFLLLSGSFLLRSSAVAGGFLWIAGDRWEKWALTLAGFLLGRILVVQTTVHPLRQGYGGHGNHTG